ncbi:MAG: thiamine ABC transporter ATP-binding protein [Alphaproteobacteria bacterium]|nr:thiamine ABC transporter ATP-binding protein [Alphaproteobacteria bacterium]
MAEPGAIVLDGVVFRYEDMTMSFDLVVPARAFLALIGPSGAGKTTLLSLIAGFERPERGRVRIGDVDVTDLAPAARPVTTLFQEHNLFAHLDVAANVGLGIDPGLRLNTADHARLAAALARVGLAGLEHRLPGQLSGGQRQRAALARSLVRDRPVLLLDEPFAALGPALRREMLDLVQDIRRERGLTVLLVSHQPEDARHAAAFAAFVQDGKILRMAPTAELFASDDLPELSEYLGVSGVK